MFLWSVVGPDEMIWPSFGHRRSLGRANLRPGLSNFHCLKTVTIAAVLLAGGTSLAMAQYGYLRLRGSLWTTGYGRNDRNYRDARRSRLRSAAIGGLRVLQLRARLLGWLRTLASWVLGRLRVWVVKLSLVCCDRSLATV